MNPNALDNFPETYLYNNYQYDVSEKDPGLVSVDIDYIVYELLQCDKNREKFELVMKGLNREFLGDDQISDDETTSVNPNIGNNNYDRSKLASIPNQQLNHSQNHSMNTNNLEQKLIPNNSFYNTKQPLLETLRSTNSSTPYYSNSIGQEIQYKPNNFNTQNSNNNSFHDKIKYHKNMIDVHANTKYHYNNTIYDNSFDNDDLILDKSQWTERSNSTLLYNNNNNINDNFYSGRQTQYNNNLNQRQMGQNNNFYNPNERSNNFQFNGSNRNHNNYIPNNQTNYMNNNNLYNNNQNLYNQYNSDFNRMKK